MASVVGICNSALQKLGAKLITALDENSVNARHCNAAYADMRDKELGAPPYWNFSVRRVQLAADPVAPAFDYAKKFQLPADCLQPVPQNAAQLDWKVEGRMILTNASAPLNLVYVAQVTDPNDFHATFRDALACRIAYQMCEAITQSNTKKADIREDYKMAIAEARRANAFANISQELPEDDWVMARDADLSRNWLRFG